MSNEPRENRPPEMPAVKTTIVWGRPPGSGTPIGSIPHGMEVLIKKAAVDPEFKTLLLAKRAEAAAEIEGLTLEPAEAAMLNGVPAAQLEAIIASTHVPDETRRSLLGRVTLTSLMAALGIVTVGSICLPTLGHTVRTRGIEPDDPRTQGIRHTQGIRPDRPPTSQEVGSGSVNPATSPAAVPQPAGIQPDYPALSRGMRPDRPRRGE